MRSVLSICSHKCNIDSQKLAGKFKIQSKWVGIDCMNAGISVIYSKEYLSFFEKQGNFL